MLSCRVQGAGGLVDHDSRTCTYAHECLGKAAFAGSGWRPQVWRGTGHHEGGEEDTGPTHEENEWGIEVVRVTHCRHVCLKWELLLAEGRCRFLPSFHLLPLELKPLRL